MDFEIVAQNQTVQLSSEALLHLPHAQPAHEAVIDKPLPPIVRIDTRTIIDWESFHSVMAHEFGFFDGYGRNLDAMIDCLTSLDEPEARMTSIHAPPGGIVVLRLDHVADFSSRCPEQYDALIDCVAFVNWRLLETNHPPVLALAFFNAG